MVSALNLARLSGRTLLSSRTQRKSEETSKYAWWPCQVSLQADIPHIYLPLFTPRAAPLLIRSFRVASFRPQLAPPDVFSLYLMSLMMFTSEDLHLDSKAGPAESTGTPTW